MGKTRILVLTLGIPGLLLYGNLVTARWRGNSALGEFTQLQKDHPADSMKVQDSGIAARKIEALVLAGRFIPDQSDVAYQYALQNLVLAESESLLPSGSPQLLDGTLDLRVAALLRDALRFINQAIARNPGEAEYHFVKSTTLQNLQAGLPGPKVAITEDAVTTLLTSSDRLNPYAPALHYRIGSFWLALGEREKAKKSYSVAIAGDRGFSKSVFSVLWSTMSSPEEMRQFVSHQPGTCVQLGEFFAKQGLKEDAEREYREAAKTGSRDYKTVTGLIGHFYNEERFEEIVSLVGRAERDGSFTKPDQRAKLRYSAGMASFQLGELEKAIDALEEALRLDPSLLHIHHVLGMVFLRHGDYSQAIARWKFALSSEWARHADPSSLLYAHLGLGQAYEKLGRYSDALAEYLRASQIDPSNGTVTLRIRKVSEKL